MCIWYNLHSKYWIKWCVHSFHGRSLVETVYSDGIKIARRKCSVHCSLGKSEISRTSSWHAGRELPWRCQVISPWVDSENGGCRVLTCHRFASPLWHYTSCLLPLKNKQFLSVFLYCFLQSVQGSRLTPLTPPFWDLTTHRVEKVSFLTHKDACREEGREGAQGWLRLCLERTDKAEARDIYRKTQACPVHSLLLNKKAGWGRQGFHSEKRGGNELNGYFTTPSSAPHLFLLLFMFLTRCLQLKLPLGGILTVLTKARGIEGKQRWSSVWT